MENYKNEIKDLHQFFEDYLSGKAAAVSLERFETVLDNHFTIVTSDGEIMNRDDIITYVRNAHHQRPNFRIWTQNVALKQHIGEIVVVTYEEWQTIDNTTTSRTSTAIFKEDHSAPHGLSWIHVHESGLKTIDEA